MLSPAQQNWHIVEKEAYALVIALENWRHLLDGYKAQDPKAKHAIEANIDSIALLGELTKPKPKRARWAARIASYNLAIR